MSVTVLAGDIGGTSARLALAEVAGDGGGIRFVERSTWPSREHAGLAEVVEAFLGEAGRRPERASFGVAAPIRDGTARFANLDWEVNESELAREIGIEHTRLVNDFDAVGHSLPLLGDGDLEVLQRGREEPEGPVAVIGAGTGLGTVLVTRREGELRVHSSEGGHLDFGPRTGAEDGLLRYLRSRYGRGSYERVVSGPGLVDVYRFLVESGRQEADPRTRRLMEDEDGAPAVISRRAMDGSDPACDAALDLFTSAYGAHAGNLALVFQATGGVYVAGGIAPEILPRLREGPFLEAFRDKGKMRSLVEDAPVRVITNTDAGLMGAARAAVD